MCVHHGPWMVLRTTLLLRLRCKVLCSTIVYTYIHTYIHTCTTMVLKYNILIYFSHVLCVRVPGIYNIFHCLLKHTLLLLGTVLVIGTHVYTPRSSPVHIIKIYLPTGSFFFSFTCSSFNTRLNAEPSYSAKLCIQDIFLLAVD